MKNGLIKIVSLFFLTILLASNIVNLHIYFHEQTEILDHCQNDESPNHDNEDESNIPCDLCHIAFVLNNLDYNSTPEFSFEISHLSQHYASKEVSVYVEPQYELLYLKTNRNKAPPKLA